MRLLLALAIGLSGFNVAVAADEKPAFKDEKEKASYAIGMNWGNQVKRAGFEVDVDVIASAIRDALAGKEPRLTDVEARQTIMAYQQEARTKVAEKNEKAGAAFLAENKNKPGVKVHPVSLAEGKTVELQYKVLQEGSGSSPKSNDVVKVQYRGTLLNGKEFDSSAKQPDGVTFPLNRVIRGWTEGLQLMKEGAKYEFFIPAELAYREMGSGTMIEPGSTLIFEVELLDVEPPQPPAAPQATTSDIIRVPSAEEIKKGAKIEVIKPEDVEKYQKQGGSPK